MPKSSRWLVDAGRTVETQRILGRPHGGGNPMDPKAQEHIKIPKPHLHLSARRRPNKKLSSC